MMANHIIQQFPAGKAITLTERLTFFKHKFEEGTQFSERELGLKRLTHWRAQSSFTEAEIFLERLALSGLSEDQLVWHLGITQPDIGEDKQKWQTILETILRQYDPNNEPIQLPETLLQRFPDARFLMAFQPFLQYALDLLQQEIAAMRTRYKMVPFDDEVAERELLRNVPRQLVFTIGRTLVLELNIARLEERLRGESAEARFDDFIDMLGQLDQLAHLFDEYPVLARSVTILTTQWVTNYVEFLKHLCEDCTVLRHTFNELNSGKHFELQTIDIGAGDRHKEGRAVGIVTFSPEFRLVYKPRSLAVDIHFQQLLRWLNDKGTLLPFRTLTILDRGDHGWAEFVASQPCNNEGQVQNFYKRQGAYLALLYALCAYDFHHENLIAVGEHPILIDLETLFAPSFITEIEKADLPAHTRENMRLFSDSVLVIGLLPQRIWVGEEQEGIDLSGLGMQEGQLTPHGVPVWNQIVTDEMHFSRERLPISGKTHQPVLQNTPVQLTNYVNEICEGFAGLYQILVQYHAELSDFLRCFNKDHIRCVTRPTRTYALMLQDSVHPDLMRDALARDQFFDKLWVGAVGNKPLRRLIKYEQQDMWRHDVPFFTTYPNSIDLWSSNGQCIKGYFDEPGIERVTAKLAQLGPDDMAHQLWIIRASLSTISRAVHRPQNRFVIQSTKTNTKTDTTPAQLIQAAVEACDHICALALESEETISWLGINHNIAGNFYTVSAVGNSLYNGSAGIALFFAYLGKLTKNDAYRILAKRISDNLRDNLQALYQDNDNESLPISIGGFEGVGSTIYTFTHLSTLLNEPELLDDAATLAHFLRQSIDKDETYDIISGAAGCIAALLALYTVRRDSSILKIARQCGDHLLSNVTQTKHGMAWMPPKSVVIKEPLTGFSHGVAGIAWALLRLTEATGEKKYAEIAQKSLAYERAFFSAESQNWQDLRDLSSLGEVSDNMPQYASFWCHGAPGIGLARLHTLHLLDDSVVCNEITAALQTAVQNGFGNGHCLCHGDLGNLEILLQARARLGSQWDADIKRITANILVSIEEHGWLCGNPHYVEEPGLMTGLAGIGYGLLRAAAPEQVPSVLLLEPPILT